MSMKYTDSHEWIRVDNGIALVGVSQFAQKELGDIVYVELPVVGKDVDAGQEIAVLESTKAAADVYSPVTGTVMEINETLASNPELINKSPQAEGWIFKIRLANPSELDLLMDENEYQTMLNGA